ncbi:DUF2239 family protein [Maritimibacter alexandrii]|uniref:DUF2239 family protein n=1 Tax=Maritimibacter alexandrii TaxID=2570355 RepID=UPI00110974DE|nr:DUF2239 family protein [Maritimibacter alexandrii]
MTEETFTAFQGTKRLASGTRGSLETDLAPLGPHPEGLLVFSDLTGRETDLNLSGTPAPAPRGRPKMGVKAREITLLPRHWDWLAGQRGGASAALRRIVDDAMNAAPSDDPRAPDRAYRFLSAIAGNLPRFEEAIRALYAGDMRGFADAMDGWPDDLRDHALTLAGAGPQNA